MKMKNKLLYIVTFIVIIIVFLVVFLSGNYMKEIVFVDSTSKQPINNIRNIVKDLPIDNNKNNNNKNNKNNNKNDGLKPNDGESPIRFVFDTDEIIDGNYIYLINQFPIKDEEGKKLHGEYQTFNFKLEFDKEALGASYVITLEKMDNSDIEDNWVKVYLERDNQSLSECIRDTGRVKTFDNYSTYNEKDNEITILGGTVNNEDIQKGYRNFTLRMWISEDVVVVDEYPSKTIAARVNVYASG